jgi:D-arabinose 5-phosphate isomerase GutQ
MSKVDYINHIFENLNSVDMAQVEPFYHDLLSAGVVIPSGEGRSKGAISVACSEMAKMSYGKRVLDRGDIGFPATDMALAAPILRRKYGQVCLLINSGSGKSLTPLLDAQKLGIYLENTGQARDFRIDLITSDPESPLGKLSAKYGNLIVLKGKDENGSPIESKEFKSYGILEDMFSLASGMLAHGMVEAMWQEAPATRVLPIVKDLGGDISALTDEFVGSELFEFLIDALEERNTCFFAGLGSSKEVVRMAAVRVGHVKRALGDLVYVSGDSNIPPPRAGDTIIVVSMSGETEIVAGWCRNFKKMGGQIASIVGTPDSTIGSLSDHTYVLKGDWKPGTPSSFYMKSAFLLSPLPIFLVERVEQRGLKLPENILRWHRSVIS